jgi:hypothetical protein
MELTGNTISPSLGVLANQVDVDITSVHSTTAIGIIEVAGSPDVTRELTGISMTMGQGFVDTGSSLIKLQLSLLTHGDLTTSPLTITKL